MRQYELVLVVRPSLTEEKRKKLIDSVKEWLKGAKFTKEESMGQKQLAYKIKKETSGYYYFVSFEDEKGIPQDFDKRVLSQDNIIRHILIRRK